MRPSKGRSSRKAARSPSNTKRRSSKPGTAAIDAGERPEFLQRRQSRGVVADQNHGAVLPLERCGGELRDGCRQRVRGPRSAPIGSFERIQRRHRAAASYAVGDAAGHAKRSGRHRPQIACAAPSARRTGEEAAALPDASSAACRGFLIYLHGLESLDAVAETRGFLELEFLRRLAHVLFQIVDELFPLLGRELLGRLRSPAAR